jgi:hypothetical protein
MRQAGEHSRFTPVERFEYLRQFGSHPMAYSTLQPGMEYFDLPGIGYIAYATCRGSRLVLSDPLGTQADNDLGRHYAAAYCRRRRHDAPVFGPWRDAFGT